MSKTIIVTGGGTGGHLSVARSFIDEFYKRGYRIIYIGSLKGQDRQWFENEPKLYKKYFFDTRGVVDQNLLGKFKSLYKILKAVVDSIGVIVKYKVSKIVSVGGFSAAAASFAAILTRKDFYIHEQNSVMGKLNKLTAKGAKEVFSSYDESSKVKDYPINQIFFEHTRIRESVKTVIFLGGSQGADAINKFALKVATALDKMNINIIHQTGKNSFKDIKEQYAELGIKADVFDFSKEILSKMDKADFAVSRAGASTLWELTALGIPTLYVPFPYAAADHQYYNAKYLIDNGLCFLKREDELTQEYLIEAINSDIGSISKMLSESIQKNGIEKIVDMIELPT
ncbi:MAG: undecaprenyldiphospho-muramoylpentapeptide beta-N-acetylglucosaminyltransferase [Campylobacterota bacterium]|nr:undecaprenyldiphospho-muramoylpentapeptide beta-N-acetylglucosaminyltransferase [Campylobacterota bacterium]